MFRRFFNWVGSLFSNKYSTIYDIDTLIDNYFKVETKDRLNGYQLSSGLENLSKYLVNEEITPKIDNSKVLLLTTDHGFESP